MVQNVSPFSKQLYGDCIQAHWLSVTTLLHSSNSTHYKDVQHLMHRRPHRRNHKDIRPPNYPTLNQSNLFRQSCQRSHIQSHCQRTRLTAYAKYRAYFTLICESISSQKFIKYQFLNSHWKANNRVMRLKKKEWMNFHALIYTVLSKVFFNNYCT